MKKMLAGVAAAALLSSGLVAVSAMTSASAAQAAPPYVPTVKTRTDVKSIKKRAPYKVRKKTAFLVFVKASGTAQPTGTLTLRFQRKVGGTWRFVKAAEHSTKPIKRTYTGGTLRIPGGKFKQVGRYRAVVTFTPKAGTVFKKSKTSRNIIIKK